jgi:hypothetical protein
MSVLYLTKSGQKKEFWKVIAKRKPSSVVGCELHQRAYPKFRGFVKTIISFLLELFQIFGYFNYFFYIYYQIIKKVANEKI